MTRRFPAPWSYDDNGSALIIKDASGLRLGYIYYRKAATISEESLTHEDAFRLAHWLLKLPELAKAPTSPDLSPS